MASNGETILFLLLHFFWISQRPIWIKFMLHGGTGKNSPGVEKIIQ
jgi:hypothetical protein